MGIVSSVLAFGLGAVIIAGVRFTWEVSDHLIKTAPMMAEFEEGKKETALFRDQMKRSIRILTRNQCFLMEIVARDRQLILPEECEEFRDSMRAKP
jgi:hypothetical protein